MQFIPRTQSLILGTVAAALFMVNAADAATVRGQLREPGVTWLSDGKGGPPQRAVMHNVAKSFVPALMVVPAGSSVQFPNDDPFFHSIYSASPADPFDIGYYDSGPGKVVTFDTPGVVMIGCHIHQRMKATLVVVDGPAQTTQRDVRFDNVPVGTFVVHAWSDGLGERTTTVRVGRGDVSLGSAL